MPAILQIVGSVGSTTALLDLNDNPTGVMVSRQGGASGLNLAAVEGGQDRMPVWSSSGVAAELTARQITVPVFLFAANIEGLGAKVATLNKLIAQPWVLRVRRSGATSDSWIRCYPAVAQMDTNITGNHGGGVVRGQIVADTEPYAYGTRVDQAAVAVPQDPSNAAAFVLDVNGVTGDSPTPAVIRTSDQSILAGTHGTLVAVRRSGTPGSLTGLTVQAEAGSAQGTVSGVTVTSPFADASFSGGNGVRFTFTAPYDPANGNAGSLSVTPALSGAQAPGLYRVLARVRRSVQQEVTFRATLAAGAYELDPVTMANAVGVNTRVMDLGVVQLPVGQPQQLAAPVATTNGSSSTPVRILVSRPLLVSGTVTVDIDWVALVPADEDTCVIFQGGVAPAGTWLTLDGHGNDPYLSTGDPFLAASPMVSGGALLDLVGGVPRLAPGANRLFVVTGLHQSNAATPVTATISTLVSYWPRYSWIA